MLLFFFLLKDNSVIVQRRNSRADMSVGAERRMDTRLKKLEEMIRDPKSAVNLESLLVSIP